MNVQLETISSLISEDLTVYNAAQGIVAYDVHAEKTEVEKRKNDLNVQSKAVERWHKDTMESIGKLLPDLKTNVSNLMGS